ncbi:hypothetical protein BDR26DRAFT_429932, partial [Obelidium mucronatum]
MVQLVAITASLAYLASVAMAATPTPTPRPTPPRPSTIISAITVSATSAAPSAQSTTTVDAATTAPTTTTTTTTTLAPIPSTIAPSTTTTTTKTIPTVITAVSTVPRTTVSTTTTSATVVSPNLITLTKGNYPIIREFKTECIDKLVVDVSGASAYFADQANGNCGPSDFKSRFNQYFAFDATNGLAVFSGFLNETVYEVAIGVKKQRDVVLEDPDAWRFFYQIARATSTTVPVAATTTCTGSAASQVSSTCTASAQVTGTAVASTAVTTCKTTTAQDGLLYTQATPKATTANKNLYASGSSAAALTVLAACMAAVLV